jgi:hypothetical protein
LQGGLRDHLGHGPERADGDRGGQGGDERGRGEQGELADGGGGQSGGQQDAWREPVQQRAQERGGEQEPHTERG